MTALPAAAQAQRRKLRAQMRALRRCMSDAERRAAARQFARLMRRTCWLQPGRRIAFYLAHDQEADPAALIRLAHRSGCQLYLPVITDYRRSRMEFLHYRVDAPLRRNRYGISEPVRGAARRIAVRHLDLIVLPFVAADDRGTRLGSGAGFYDRCLQHLSVGRRWRRPKLVGLGYEFQRVPHLERQPWDVPLDALLTEKTLHFVRGAP